MQTAQTPAGSRPSIGRGRALAAALGASVMWGGVMPLYWRGIRAIPPLETLAHRILWTLVLLLTLLGPRRVRAALAAPTTPKRWRYAALGAAIIASNWLIYIWGVREQHMSEASLGYYIGPLLTTLLGFFVLREPLRPLQMVSVAWAAVGVGFLVVQRGQVPWFGLGLATSFSAYALVRKLSRLHGIQGLVVETIFLAPPAVLYLVWLQVSGTARFMQAPHLAQGLLLGAGALASLPLVLFGAASQGLPLVTLGLLQFLAPTIGLAVAVLGFGEAMTPLMWLTFSCIWCAIGLYLLDGERSRQGALSRPAARAPRH